MSSKVDQLENHQDQVTELSHLKKSKGNHETERQNKSVEITDSSATDAVMNESNKTHREIIIEIDIFQRTAVFSSDFTMWI